MLAQREKQTASKLDCFVPWRILEEYLQCLGNIQSFVFTVPLKSFNVEAVLQCKFGQAQTEFAFSCRRLSFLNLFAES